MYDANGRESFSTVEEVVEISNVTLDQALFEVPVDYREVKYPSEMYAIGGKSETSRQSSGIDASNSPISSNVRLPGASSSPGNAVAPNGGRPETPLSSPISSNVLLPGPDSSPGNVAAPKSDEQNAVSTKKPGMIRVGLAGVRIATVGEGINAAELSAAIQNSLGEYLKGTKIEIVPLEAKLASAQSEEAKRKGCDYVIVATASHKKGGGSGFGKMLAQTVAQTGIPHTGGVAGNVAGQAATTAINAASMSGSFKSKDELTLDLKLLSTTDNSSPLTKQFKAKAKSDGDDIITSVVEQAAQAIVDAVGK
jgi:hypothetical protein